MYIFNPDRHFAFNKTSNPGVQIRKFPDPEKPILRTTLNRTITLHLPTITNNIPIIYLQKTYPTECLEVNGTLNVLLTVNGTDRQYYYDFGDGTNLTSSVSIATHSYSTHGDYVLNLTAFNDVSSAMNNSISVKVCKPEMPIVTLAVTTSPTNISDPVEFSMTMAEGSDFACFFDFGDGSFKFFAKECYNLTYFADGVNTDKAPFRNLAFKVSHNYSNVGTYDVYVNCSNRLGMANFSLFAIVQKPIEDLELPEIPPKILGKNFPVIWTMTKGTNVTFSLQIQGTPYSYSSFKTDIGDSPLVNVSLNGIFPVTLQAKNLVSEVNRSIILIVQDDVTNVTFNTFTTASDFGSNIHGFGPDKNVFPCEHKVNFTATPDKGFNLTFWWKFDDDKGINTTTSSYTHQFAEGENEYWTNVTVFNLVSSVSKVFLVKTEKSVMGLTIKDNSPVKVNLTTIFELSFLKYGTRTCITMDMGDEHGFIVIGGSHCQTHFSGHKYIQHSNERALSITQNYTYKTVDDFWVKLVANNTVSRQEKEFKSVTLKLECYYPNASIMGECHIFLSLYVLLQC